MEPAEFLSKMRAEVRREVIEDQIRYLRAQLAAGDVTEGPSLKGKGITEAAEIVLRETGPRGTREIGQILLARGIQTKSRNFTASLYRCLLQAKDTFKRTPDGNWVLRGKGER